MTFYGVNFSGAEFGVSTDGAFDYSQAPMWFPKGHYDYFKAKGFNLARIPVAWDRLQPNLNGPLDPTYFAKLDAAVVYATSIGLTVVIDIHNYARRNGALIGSSTVLNSAFNDLWAKLANTYKSNPKVIFGLMNEPHDMPTAQWLATANSVSAAIRATGATNTIFVSANYWGGPEAWMNGEMDGYLDSNYVIEVHRYLNSNGSGQTSDVVSSTILRDRLSSMVAWCKSRGKKFFLGEFSTGPTDPNAKAAITDGLNFLAANSDVCVGWAWWACIGDAPPNDQWTPYAINPSLDYKTDDAKVAWLTPFTGTSTVPVPTPAPTPTGTYPTAPVNFNKGGVTKIANYWVQVPTNYSHNVPMKLFVWLHGCGGYSANDVGMVAGADYISLTPDGREGACWSDVTTDGPKILAAIADVKTRFNIAEVWLGGYSSGGDVGYPLLFKNSQLFAGALFENTGPDANAMTLAQTATKKLTIHHLAHLSDNVYPVAGLRTKFASLKSLGHNANLYEKSLGQ